MVRPEQQGSEPRRLIDDAYSIDGIELAECRAIFFGWILGLPDGVDMQQEIRILLNKHARANSGHPMTSILLEGVAANTARPRRRVQR